MVLTGVPGCFKSTQFKKIASVGMLGTKIWLLVNQFLFFCMGINPYLCIQTATSNKPSQPIKSKPPIYV